MIRGPIRTALWAGSLVLSGCATDVGDTPTARSEPVPAASVPGEPPFVERAAQVGVDFVHFNGRSGEYYLDEITCGGGAFVDTDDDGDLDVYLVQGTILGQGKTMADALDTPAHPVPLSDRLYRNDLDGSGLRFTDVTEESGLARLALGYGCSIATGDVDNDGWIDLYVLDLGPNQLLRNRGDGTFDDITAEAGAGLGDAGSGVAGVFFDYDRDGWLDLYVGNNVTFDPTGKTRCYSLTGAIDYCGPAAYPPQRDRLFHNLGGGRFEDATRTSGLASAPARPTLGAVAGDFDGDGWLDLYVANDGQPNNLWRNRGDGTFEDLGIVSGSAVNAMGAAEASMGVDAADFDGDGDLDLFMAHLIKETNTLFVNDGGGRFVDATATAALSAPSLPYTSFGTGFFDLENDGRLDLLLVNGAVTNLPELVRAGDPTPLHQPNQLFRNLGPDGSGRIRFEETPHLEGDPLGLSEVSRAAVFGDVDNDGDTDVLVVNNGGPVRLLINRLGQDRPWIGARVVREFGDGGGGETAPALRDEPGAMVALLRAGRPVVWRRAHTDGSFNAAHDPRVLFGLGGEASDGSLDGKATGEAKVEGLRVVWPDGSAEDFLDLPARAYHRLVHGRGRRVAQ